jgi:hypothetical protein
MDSFRYYRNYGNRYYRNYGFISIISSLRDGARGGEIEVGKDSGGRKNYKLNFGTKTTAEPGIRQPNESKKSESKKTRTNETRASTKQTRVRTKDTRVRTKDTKKE